MSLLSAGEPAPVVLFFIGNPSRGDDALGPEIHGRLAAWLENAGLAAGFDLIEDFQLQIEHALDLQGRQLALFVDAAVDTPAPFVFKPLAASTAIAHTSHALAPEAVLQVFQQTEGRSPPPAFVLAIQGASFELGAALSPPAEQHAAAALSFLQELCRQPELPVWQMLAKKSQVA